METKLDASSPARAKPDHLTDTIANLRARAIKEQERGAKIQQRHGHTDAEIRKNLPSWTVRVKAGDLLRILDALEKTK